LQRRNDAVTAEQRAKPRDASGEEVLALDHAPQDAQITERSLQNPVQQQAVAADLRAMVVPLPTAAVRRSLGPICLRSAVCLRPDLGLVG